MVVSDGEGGLGESEGRAPRHYAWRGARGARCAKRNEGVVEGYGAVLPGRQIGKGRTCREKVRNARIEGKKDANASISFRGVAHFVRNVKSVDINVTFFGL